MKTHRIRRTADQWQALIDQQAQSGLTIRAFCKSHDVGLASFGKWKKKLVESAASNSALTKHAPFQEVSVASPADQLPAAEEPTVVTLSLGSNITMTITTRGSAV